MNTSVRAVCHLAALLLLGFSTGCEDPPPAPDVYHVRGQVRQLPADATGTPEGRRGAEIHVRHEAVPDFKNADGEVVGMDSMSMPFPLADIALAGGVEVGDKIEMEFEVSWHGDGNPLRVTAIEKLPAETRLGFEAAEPESGEREDPQ